MPDPTALAALHAQSFVTPRPWSAQEFADILTNPRVFLLGDSSAFLIGHCVADEAELLTLAVATEMRRTGKGRALTQEFLRESAQRNARRAFLEVAADNHPAIALYTGCGFVQVGRRKRYYTAADGQPMDALVLSATL